jgi:hypothetical protein
MIKKLLLILPLTLFSVPVEAQQTNLYQVCTAYQENYSPGYYDQYGNYRQGNVYTQSYNAQCGNGNYYNSNNGVSTPYYGSQSFQQPYYYRRSCSAGAIGAILGGFGAYRATNRVSNRWFTIPLGILGGSVVGNSFCNY